MRRRTRSWLMSLGGVLVVAGALVYYGLAALAPPASSPTPVLHTSFGDLQGSMEAGLRVYRGIPYAAPPVGELRWRPPAPASWKGILNARQFKPACPQVGGALPGQPVEPMSEDCLGLNIWTPAGQPDEKLPVLVFLHGGQFTNGSTRPRLYWGDALARRGLVVVTVQYRLSVLGLLAHPELSAESPHQSSGNYALLDCIAALAWVKAHISAFGGDPGRVTVLGQSAGAYIASELMASPLSRGLFKRVIGMSGADMGVAGEAGDIPLKAQAEAAGIEFAKRVGASSLADLRHLPSDTLIRVAAALPHTPINLPIIDGYVLPQEVHAALSQPSDADIDLLVGIDAQDGATLMGIPESARAYIAHLGERYGEQAQRFLAHFPGQSDAEAAASQARLATADVAWRTYTWGKLHAAHGRGRTYAYVFSRVPPWPPFRTLHAAAHGAELPYVFGFPPKVVFFATSWPWKAVRDATLAGQIQSYWTQFARTGDPNGGGLPHWSQLKDTEVLDLGDSTRMTQLPDADGFALMEAHWRALRHEGAAD